MVTRLFQLLDLLRSFGWKDLAWWLFCGCMSCVLVAFVYLLLGGFFVGMGPETPAVIIDLGEQALYGIFVLCVGLWFWVWSKLFGGGWQPQR